MSMEVISGNVVTAVTVGLVWQSAAAAAAAAVDGGRRSWSWKRFKTLGACELMLPV
jgi:hypothetical protein